MRKGLTTLLVVLLAVGAMLVSCKAEVGTPADELVSASFELGSSRALSATLDSWTPEEYYWKYAAKKNVADTSGLTSGTTTAYTETGAEWVKVASGAPVAGLSGHIVPNFSQGLWDFTLFAYKKDGTDYKLIYQGEATAATLVKGGENLVNVVVSPIPTGTGTLYIGATSLTPHTSGDVPSVSRFLKVEDLDGHEYAPTSGTTYELATGAYKVTVTYKTSGITYAEGSVIATVYPNMTTTVTGSVDELVTYAQFEATQNPDIIARTAEVTGITANQLVPTGEYTLQDTSATTTEPAVVTATIPEAAAKALIGSIDPSATMSLALNVDTVDSTSTSVTYEIGMTKTVTLNSQSTTSDVTDVSEFVSVEIALRSGLTGVAVVHGTTGMTPSATKAAYNASTVETFFYDSDAGKLYIKTKSFSPFAVTFDGQTAGVAEVNGVKYATLKDAVEAAPAGATVKLLMNADGAGMTINKNLTIDLNGKTYTGTKDPAGSSGTKNQLFQLLGGTIVVKNGTLASTAGSGIRMLIQNYSNLTLEGVALDGTSLGEGEYVFSNNQGDIRLTDGTSIVAPEDGMAFDVCSGWGGYKSTKVAVESAIIAGAIEVADYGASDKVELVIEGGLFTDELVTPSPYQTDKVSISIVGGSFTWDPTEYVPESGYIILYDETTKLWTVMTPEEIVRQMAIDAGADPATIVVGYDTDEEMYYAIGTLSDGVRYCFYDDESVYVQDATNFNGWDGKTTDIAKYTVGKLIAVDGLLQNSFSSNTTVTTIAFTGNLSSAYKPFDGNTVLSTIDFTNLTEIPNRLFYNANGLVSVTIPDTITSIGPGAFMSCSNLETLVLPEGLTCIPDSFVYECTKLTSMNIPSTVTSIARNGIRKVGLESVTIPAGVSTIGFMAFRDCENLTTILVEIETADGLSIALDAFQNVSAPYPVTTMTVMKDDVYTYITSLELSSADYITIVKGKTQQ